jgi:CHAT domain-containing protein/Tfp pilus assembly protein PilF
MFWLVAGTATLLRPVPPPARADVSTSDAADSLQAQIDSLRVLGHYGDAVGIAEQLLRLREGDSASKRYQVVDAEWTLKTVRAASALPDSDRQRLADADLAGQESQDAYAAGKYSLAEDKERRAFEARRDILGPEHVDVALSLNNLGFLRQLREDYAAADSLYRQGLEMRRKLLGEEHPEVAQGLNNLGHLLQLRGEYDAAESYLRESLALYRRLLGEDAYDVAQVLNNLGSLLADRGEFASAEPLLRESVALRRKLFGEVHPALTPAINSLALLLQRRGDLDTAEPLLREALAISRKLYGDGHPIVATGLNNLGALLSERGDYEGAEQQYHDALAIYRRLLGEDNRNVAATLNNLAAAVAARGDQDQAEQLSRDALAILRRLLGDEHPDVALAEHNLAGLLYVQGEYDEAESLYREAIDLFRSLLGEEHPYLARGLGHLAETLHARGDDVGAASALAEAARVFESARVRAGTGLKRMELEGSPYAQLAAARLKLGRQAEAWPAMEADRARALFDLLVAADSRSLSGDEAAREDSLKVALGDAERRYLAFRKATRSDLTDEAAQRAAEARSELLRIEATWSAFEQQMAESHSTTEGRPYPLARVQRHLRPDAAILGWLEVRWKKGDRELWSYVIRAQGEVRWARLAVDPAVLEPASFRSELADPRSSLATLARDGRSMSTARLDPIGKALRGVNHLLVIPSPAMAAVPLEALGDGSGRSLAERFTISYIPSATIYAWLMEKGSPPGRGGAALLVGDPPFTDSRPAAMHDAEPAKPLLAEADEAEATERPDRGRREAPQDLDSLPRLRGARAEVESLAVLDPTATLLVGPDATEQEIVRIALSGEIATYRTLHFATHARVDDAHPENSCLVLSRVDLPDPLRAAMDGTRVYDGTLSAKEILQEWRLDADLVTLSACDTGLESEGKGAGTVGLALAFLQAGARSLLVSLWKVDDRATSLLMQRFYENWWKKGMSKAKSLQEAKRWLRETVDGSGRHPYEHPYYWSAFILIGDPR